MSKLGGNSPSADTDKSNNLVGPPGLVQSVVGGSNCSVDSGDVNHPIVNADAKASPTTTKGDVVARGAATDERIAVGTDGQVLVADSAESAGVKFADPTAVSPTTTKGDIIARGTSEDERIAVGTNGQVLVADSAESAGVKFADAAAGGQNTTKGDLEGFSTVAARIPVGTNDQVLTADSAEALGVKWADAAGGGGGAVHMHIYESQSLDVTKTSSTSGNATKGIWVAVHSNMTVHDVAIAMRTAATNQHHMFIAKEAATTNEIDSIVAVSLTLPVPEEAHSVTSMHHFNFAAPVTLVAGERYFFGVVREGDGNSAACNLIIDTSYRVPSNDFTPEEVAQYADQLDPIAGDSTGSIGDTISCQMAITYDLGVVVAGPAGASFAELPADSNYAMTGELAASNSRRLDGQLFANYVMLDFIYFDGATTIDEIALNSATTATAGTVKVGLHPIASRLSIGAQAHTADITTTATANAKFTQAVSWTPTKGWYAIAMWSSTTLSNLVGAFSDVGSGTARFFPAYAYSTTGDAETEMATHILYKDDYDTVPDLSAIDFNDLTNYDVASTNGKLINNTIVVMLEFKVS